MELGLALPHTGPLASAAFVREFAATADECGFASLWAVDHVAVPRHVESLYPLGETPRRLPDGVVNRWMAPSYEQLTTLAFVAGVTRRARLGTGVSVLTLRNPVVHARMLATIDVYSGGRLVCGVGAGWLREEAEAIGVPWSERGARAEEHVALLRALWSAEGDEVSFAGRFHRVPPIHPEPRPAQRPAPPILVGGHGDAALRRAGRIGDGWLAGPMSAERAAELWPRVLVAARAAGRDPARLRLSVGASFAIQAGGPSAGATGPRGARPDGAMGESNLGVLEDRVTSYAAIGAHELRLAVTGSSPDAVLAAIPRLAERLLPAATARG